MKYNIKNILDECKLDYIIDESEIVNHKKYKIRFEDNSLIVITIGDSSSDFIYSIFTGPNRDYFITDCLPLDKIKNFIENIKSYLDNVNIYEI